MKKIYSVFLSLFMVFSLVGCAGKASAAGTFEGVGKGRNGDIKVAVTLDDDAKITNIEVKESSETEGVGTLAYDKMIPSMVEGNTVAVDTVSTATITSEGLLEAVKDALKNAGVDEANYTQKASSSNRKIRNMTLTLLSLAAAVRVWQQLLVQALMVQKFLFLKRLVLLEATQSLVKVHTIPVILLDRRTLK